MELGSELISRRDEIIFKRKKLFGVCFRVLGVRFWRLRGSFRGLEGHFALCGYLFRTQRDFFVIFPIFLNVAVELSS